MHQADFSYCGCLCKNTLKLTFLPQNGRSRISPLLNLEKHRDRKRDKERTATERKGKKVNKKELKTARLFAPTWLDLKEEREKRQRLTDAWEALKNGNKSERKRGRGGEEGEEICAQPQKAR